MRVLFIVILAMVLFKLTVGLVAITLPILVTVALIVGVVYLLKRLVCGRREERKRDFDRADYPPQARSAMDRIERRIEDLETVLMDKR